MGLAWYPVAVGIDSASFNCSTSLLATGIIVELAMVFQKSQMATLHFVTHLTATVLCFITTVELLVWVQRPPYLAPSTTEFSSMDYSCH